MDIQFIPTSNFFPDTGKKSFVILHGTAGGMSALGIANYFKSTEGSPNPVSSHYVVGKDGKIIQMVEEKDGAFGNGVVTNSNWIGNPNFYTISIEVVKSMSDNSDEITPLQKQAAFPLIRDICLRNNIGMHPADNQSGITGHFSIDPVNRARCPGNFPWQELWNFLMVGGIMPDKNQLQAMFDCWNSVLKNMVPGNAPMGTAIYTDWQQNYLVGKFYGPPITHEYQSVDWQGKTIIVQEFVRGRAEYSNGKVMWYV